MILCLSRKDNIKLLGEKLLKDLTKQEFCDTITTSFSLNKDGEEYLLYADMVNVGEWRGRIVIDVGVATTVEELVERTIERFDLKDRVESFDDLRWYRELKENHQYG